MKKQYLPSNKERSLFWRIRITAFCLTSSEEGTVDYLQIRKLSPSYFITRETSAGGDYDPCFYVAYSVIEHIPNKSILTSNLPSVAENNLVITQHMNKCDQIAVETNY